MSVVVTVSCRRELADVSSEAKLVSYSSLEELEDAAKLIVIGKKTHDLKQLWNDPEVPFGALSSFIIDTVVKDIGGIIHIGDEITVLEHETVSEKLGQRIHLADYTAMNNADRYVLF